MRSAAWRNNEWAGFLENAYNLVGGIIEWDGEVVVY
jgi:hypothetical protein